MVDEALFSSLRKPLSTAQGVFIFLPSDPLFDQIASSLGLFLSLKKAGKAPSIACSTAMKVEHSDLVGVDQIKSEVKGQNLIVAFDYVEDSIEKVSYNIDENSRKFNLVIQAKAGQPPLASDKLKYSYAGGQADLIFTVGSRSLDDLGKLYLDSKSTFEQQKIIDIDLVPKSKRFAQTEVILNASSFSEVVTRLISFLNLPVDQDIASNLLLGIERASRTFVSPRVSAATFEAAAFCLRAGARREAVISRSTTPGIRKKVPFKPMPAAVSATKKPPITADEEKSKGKKPSSDWLEPKIYKGNTRI